ncbi:MAG: ROK family protein [Bacteroidota bacterium]
MKILGIDVGGSGIKGALVNSKNGEMLTKRHRIPTPQPAKPDAVGDTIAEIAAHFDWDGPIGCTFPAIIKNGVAYSASNVHKSWIGTDVAKLVKKKTGCPAVALNDADAAGLCEMTFGAGKGVEGTVLTLTFGTGIGSGMFVDGTLVPNTELGHLKWKGYTKVEAWAASKVRTEEDLSWAEWAERANAYLQHVEFLFSPDLFILGGGVSNEKKRDNWMPLLDLNTPIEPAQFGNHAGIIGAAMAAYREKKR